MELLKKNVFTRVKDVGGTISKDNLFLLSSSISYYSALAIAPFMLILLTVAALIGEGLQQRIINHAATTMSPRAAEMIQMLFQNINEGINIGSISGIIGALVLLSTASLVFLQFRYSFDVINGDYDPKAKKSIKDSLLEKAFAMFFVILIALIFVGSVVGSGFFMKYVGSKIPGAFSALTVVYVNFMIYLGLFTAVHTFVPSRRRPIYDTLKQGALSALFFMVGNFLLAFYLQKVAANSVYGAASVLLVFLVWSYYSSFIIFLSSEIFNYLKKMGKVH